MTITPIVGLTKIRKVHVLINNTSGLEYIVHNNNRTTLTRALLERVFLVKTPTGFAPPPRPTVEFKTFLSPFFNKMVKGIKTATPWSSEELLATYRGRQLSIYTNAMKDLELEPVRRKDAYITAFVKAEKINLSAKPNPAPRLIQPRNPRYIFEVAKYLKSIEHKIYKRIKKAYGSPTVTKGMNAQELGTLVNKKWQRFAHPIAVGLDASRFDQHCSPEILQWEHSVYNSYFGNDPHLRELLTWQIQQTGYANAEDCKIKYQVSGCRGSGDINTGMGNCLIMCALVYMYCVTHNISKRELLNNGDDCVLIIEREDLSRLDDVNDWFMKCGFNMKVEDPVDDIHKITFCQTQPVQHREDEWIMSRDPRVCLTKDLVCFQMLDDENSWKYQCQSICDCGLAAYGALPVFGAFYSSLDRKYRKSSRETIRYSGLWYMSQGMHHKFEPPSTLSRVTFWEAFDITPDEQVALEEHYLGLVVTYKPRLVGNYQPSPLAFLTNPTS